MFAVIEVNRKDKSVFRKLISSLSCSQPELIKVAVKSGAPYFIIRVSGSKKIPWDDITYMVGRCSSNLLIGKETKVPDELKKRCFSPKLLPLLMLSNTATDMLKGSAKKLNVGIVDPFAVLNTRIYEYADFSSNITVVTKKTSDYIGICEELTDCFGIGASVTENIDRIKNCDIVISEKGVEAEICFCIRGNGSKNCFEFFDFMLPPVYEQKIPNGIDREDFAGALYELCGVRRISELKFKKVKLGENVFFVDEIKNRSVILPTCH